MGGRYEIRTPIPMRAVGTELVPTHTKDGRRILPEPCEFAHKHQSMECPSCAQKVHGVTEANSDPAWWSWFRKRYGKKA